MLYKSVLLYADRNHPGFTQFCLPACCPDNLDNEMVRVSMPLRRSNMHQSNMHMGSPCPPCRMGVAKNNVNSTNDEDDTNNNSEDYDDFGNLKKKRALTTTKKKKSKMTTKTTTTPTATKKTGGKRCNNKSRHIKEATISHNSQLSVKIDVEGDMVGDVVGNVDGNDNDFAERHYEKTKKHNWVMHADG
jgi:hypothetical protein